MEGIRAFSWKKLLCGQVGHPWEPMTPLDQTNPVEVGERLRIARDAADINQATAAAAIKVARTTLLAIEKGERRVRMNELQQLAKLYGTSVNALLRREAVHVDLTPRFRKLCGN